MSMEPSSRAFACDAIEGGFSSSKTCSQSYLLDIWHKIILHLKDEGFDQNALMWIDPLSPFELSDATIIMSAPTRFARDTIKSKFSTKILQKWQTYIPQLTSIDIIIGRQKRTPSPEKKSPVIVSSPVQKQKTVQTVPRKVSEIIHEDLPLINQASDRDRHILDHVHNSQEIVSVSDASVSQDNQLGQNIVFDPETHVFDIRYTFDNFVVGRSNELAHAAAKKVAECKGVNFNPLFLHGGVGLGKTHLMHAIALHLQEHFNNKTVIYLSAEQFMHKFVSALRTKDTQTFKTQFRNVDVLMIDDLQFISGKPQTQEEFFHTFNALVDGKKQIIISADRSPNDMGNMEDRIRSRLSWGLVVDIHQTDLPLRVGILNSKIKLLQKEYPTFFVPDQVIEYLAKRITGNVRELEGAINRIAAHSAFTGKAVTLDLTEEVIADLLRMYEKKTGVNEIKKKICDYFGVSCADLDSSRRSRDIAYPRQIAMYLAKNMTGLSYPEIGRKFGGKDHSTVIHAVHKIEIAMNESNDINEQINELKNLVKIG